MLIIFTAMQDMKKRNWLEDLYTEHVSSMYTVALRILDDKNLAEDAVQEAFIKISRNMDKITQIDCNKIRAFLVIITRNASIDIYRRRKKLHGLSYEELEDELPAPELSIEDIIINNEMFKEVAQRIKELNPSYADIIALKYYYQYEDLEISYILEITPENVRTKLHRARQSLIKLLAKEQEAINNESTRIS